MIASKVYFNEGRLSRQAIMREIDGTLSRLGTDYLDLYICLLYTSATCPTVRKQIGKTTYIVRVHFSETAKETMEDKIKRMLREEVRKM